MTLIPTSPFSHTYPLPSTCFIFTTRTWFNFLNGACMCVNKKKRCDNSCLGYRNVGMWTFNNTTTIEDESCRTHPNKTNTIQTWSPREDLVVLV